MNTHVQYLSKSTWVSYFEPPPAAKLLGMVHIYKVISNSPCSFLSDHVCIPNTFSRKVVLRENNHFEKFFFFLTFCGRSIFRVSFSWKQVSEGGRFMCGSCATGTWSLLEDAPQLTAVNRPESVLYTHLKSVFIVRSLHIKEGSEKKAPIFHCGTEQLTKSFLSTDDAFTPALLHPVVWNVWTVRFVIRCGSYIHTWWVPLQQYLILLWQHYGISRPVLALKCEKRRKNTVEEVEMQTEKNVNSLLPIKTIRVCVIVF